MANYEITGKTFSLKEGITLDQIVSGYDIEVKLEETTCQVVRTSQPVHAGTFDDPYDITDALLVCQLAGSNGQWGFVKGNISDKGSFQTGSNNCFKQAYITDDSDKQLMLYYLNRYQNYKYGTDSGFDDENDISVGDEVVVNCKLMTFKSTLEANPANLISLNGVESTRRIVVVNGDEIFDGATVAIYAWTDGQENGRIILATNGVFYLPNTLDSFIILRLDPNQSYSTGDDGYYLEGIWS